MNSYPYLYLPILRMNEMTSIPFNSIIPLTSTPSFRVHNYIPYIRIRNWIN